MPVFTAVRIKIWMIGIMTKRDFEVVPGALEEPAVPTPHLQKEGA